MNHFKKPISLLLLCLMIISTSIKPVMAQGINKAQGSVPGNKINVEASVIAADNATTPCRYSLTDPCSPKPESLAHSEFDIPLIKVMDKRSWFSKYKWLLLIAAVAAAGAAMSQGSDDESPQDTGEITIGW